MAKSLITQTLGVRGLIEISDKISRLSEAGYAFGKKLRELEHQFDAAAFFSSRGLSRRRSAIHGSVAQLPPVEVGQSDL
jgi:hypothetical protein